MPIARLNGTRICFETGGSGPPLLLLHGSGLEHGVFRPWLDGLCADATLVHVDQRGCGRSEPLGPDFDGHRTWIDDLEALRRHLGHEQVVVLGHSYGGCLAMEYALRFPRAVRGLVVDGCYPAFDYWPRVDEHLRRHATEAQRAAFAAALGEPFPDDAAVERFWRTIAPLYFVRWDPGYLDRLFGRGPYRAETLTWIARRGMPAFDVRSRLGEIAAPTLVLQGRHDFIVPPEPGGVRIAAGIRGSRLVVFEESGHWPFIEENAAYLAVVRRWLSGL